MADHNGDEFKSWKENSLCFRLVDLGLVSADLWYQGDFTPESKEAADICFQCPVRQECLKKSCEIKEEFGIWGGLPVSLRKKRGRAHNMARLKALPNPYSTTDVESPYFIGNLTEGDQDEQ